MKYTFIHPDGTIGHTREFLDGAPSLAAVKGRWIPNNPPPYNTMTHNLQIEHEALGTADVMPFFITPKPLKELRANKMRDLDDDRLVSQARDICVQGVCFSGNRSQREVYAGLATMVARGQGLPTQVIQSVDGRDVALTGELVTMIEDTMNAHLVESWAHYNNLINDLEQAGDLDSIEAVNW